MLVSVAERSRVAEARRLACQAATQQGFSETDIGRVAIAATELATNLVKHSGAERSSLGPSMIVRERAWSSLRSTRDPASATCRRLSPTVIPRQVAPGPALGAAHRAANVFAISTRPGHGTARALFRWSAGDR